MNMFLDLLVGIAASLIASFIFGFFTNRLFGKNNNDILLKIYMIYVSCSVFIVALMLSYITNSEIVNMIATMAEVNIFTIYKHSFMSFVWIALQLSLVTIAFLIIRLIELTTKSMERTIKSMDEAYYDYVKSMDKTHFDYLKSCQSKEQEEK